MRLHRLSLTNVKGVTHREVVFPDRGVVVLEGANEIGKTSLIEALDLVFDYKDSSRDRRVLAIRPVGLDVASAIEVELSTGPYRFRYRKQWFRQPGTTLTLTAPRHEHKVGPAAHERVQEILAQTADLTLWKALRLMQAAPLDQSDLAGSSALAAALDAAAGRTPDADGAGDSLVDTVQGIVTSYFTPRAGAQTGEYRVACERLTGAEEEVARTTAAVEEVRDDVARHAVVAAQLATSEAELVVAEASLARAQAAWQQVAELSGDVEQATDALAMADRELERERARQTERERLRADVELARHRLGQLAALDDELAGQVRPQQDRVATLTAQVATAEEVAERLRARCELARADEGHLRDVAELSGVQARLDRLAEVDGDPGSAQPSDPASEPLVDEPTLATIEAAARACDLARAAQQAGGGSVTLSGMSGRRGVRLDGRQLRPAKGEVVERSLIETVEVVVPGVISLMICPPDGAEGRAEEVRLAEGELAAALALAGVCDVARARSCHAAYRRAVSAARQREQRRADLLGSDRLEDLHRRAGVLRARCDAYRAFRTASGVALPSHVGDCADDLAAATSDHERARTAVGELTRAVTGARAELTETQVALARAAALRESLTEQVGAQAERLTAIWAQEPDDRLDGAVVERDRRCAAAREQLLALSQRLAHADPETVRACLSQARTGLERVDRQRQELHDERVGIEARLTRAGRDGRQESHEAATGELERARRAHRAVQRRASATRLLHETLQRHRAEAKRAYVEPFRSAISRVGQQVYGPDFSVEVDDSLAVRARVLAGQRIDYEALSTGAKEQLAIITRLACASLVDPQSGVPVVIDDALGYSDPDRLRRVGAAFAMVGPEAQVLLLTCTPGRYAAIPDAEVIRLS
ncbi:MAG TPA: hypothetical protein VES01_02120 [Dermatophilaceae bacterium]|nr:hypothetical protein [Dermatophilaceae bacterium]